MTNEEDTMEPRREGAVLTNFRTVNDQERIRILRLKIENLQLSVRSAKTAIAQVERQADELTDYMDVLEDGPASDGITPEDRARLLYALKCAVESNLPLTTAEPAEFERLIRQFGS